MKRHATSFIELMVALAILALTVVPIYEFFTRISDVPAISEDILYAEVLASRVAERYGAFSFEELEALAGQDHGNILAPFFEQDREEDWFGEIPEYKRNLGVGKSKFTGQLAVSKIEDGLLAIDVVITWSPQSRGSSIKKGSTYTLMKFVSKADLGITCQEKEPEL